MTYCITYCIKLESAEKQLTLKINAKRTQTEAKTNETVIKSLRGTRRLLRQHMRQIQSKRSIQVDKNMDK